MKTRLVFFGSPQFSVGFLQALEKEFSICLVVTAPDKPMAHHGNRIAKVKTYAGQKNIPVLSPSKLDNKTIDKIIASGPKVGVVVAYGKILPDKLINGIPYGLINVHGSILPKYRGASPIEAAILSGDKKTGPTITKVTPELDAGPILSQAEFDLDQLNQEETYRQMAKIGQPLLIKSLKNYLKGKATLRPQDNQNATFTKIINKADGLLDFNKTATELERQIRAFHSWPTSYFYYNKRRITVKQARKYHQFDQPIGIVFRHGKKLLVACKNSSLEIIDLTPESKKTIKAVDFLNSHPEITHL